MDRQTLRGFLQRLAGRFDRRPPRPFTIYGRRAVPAAGFSPAELADAGLDEDSARGLGLPVDLSRMSALGSNIEQLREFLKR